MQRETSSGLQMIILGNPILRKGQFLSIYCLNKMDKKILKNKIPHKSLSTFVLLTNFFYHNKNLVWENVKINSSNYITKFLQYLAMEKQLFVAYHVNEVHQL
jgi:hypothetical protein